MKPSFFPVRMESGSTIWAWAPTSKAASNSQTTRNGESKEQEGRHFYGPRHGVVAHLARRLIQESLDTPLLALLFKANRIGTLQWRLLFV